MGLGGEAAADAEGVADLFVAVDLALDGGEGDVVDLRVGAPERAAGDGDLELAREVVELGVGGERRGRSRRRAGQASRSSWRSRPARGQPVTLRTTSPQAPLGERPIAVRASTTSASDVDGEPVELDVLAGGDVGEVAGVLLREMRR